MLENPDTIYLGAGNSCQDNYPACPWQIPPENEAELASEISTSIRTAKDYDLGLPIRNPMARTECLEPSNAAIHRHPPQRQYVAGTDGNWLSRIRQVAFRILS
jgi:hypothetical protein